MKDKDLIKDAARFAHWIVGFVIFCVVLASWGCAPKERTVTVYKDVLIPIKCRAEIPQKPEPVANAVEMNLLILKYTESLETALRSCL